MNKTIKIIIMILLLFMGLITANCGQPSIYQLAEEGDIQAVKAALENDPKLIHKTDAGYNTLMHAAAKGGQNQILDFLLSIGGNMYQTRGKKYKLGTPLEVAAQYGQLDTVKYLLEKDCDPEHQKDRPMRLSHALTSAAWRGQNHIVKFLISRGTRLEGGEHPYSSPLEAAVYDNNIELVKLLLEYGAKITKRKNRRWGVIHLAAMRGNMDIVRLFLEKGADVNLRSYNGKTALHIVSTHAMPHPGLLKLFIDYGADVNAKNNTKDTPLHYAVDRRRAKTVEFLLKHGAETHHKDVMGRVPMTVAFEKASQPVMDALMVLHRHAGKSDAATMAEMIKTYPQLINSRDMAGKTPLHYAAQNNRLENARLLIANSADLHAVSELKETQLVHGVIARIVVPGDGRIKWKKEKKTPLQMAMQENHTAMVQLLKTGSSVKK